MSQVRVHSFAVSLDGFGTGEGQSLDEPFGHAGTRLLEGFMGTRTFRTMHGGSGGSTGVDEASPATGHRASVPRSWAATSSVRSAAPGPTRTGRAGGATIPSSTLRCSS